MFHFFFFPTSDLYWPAVVFGLQVNKQDPLLLFLQCGHLFRASSHSSYCLHSSFFTAVPVAEDTPTEHLQYVGTV